MKFFKKHIWLKNILAIFVILVVLFLIINLFLRITTRHNIELSVPDFTNMSVPEAEIIAAKNHLRLDVTDSVYIKRMGRGLISRQTPDAGSKVKKNRRILLTINSVNPKLVEMPSLTGYSLRQAKTELLSLGLVVGKLIYVEDMATNNVLAQKYNGENIEPGTLIETDTPIDLILGLNSKSDITYIPNVTGYRYITAKDILNDNSLNISKITFDESVINYSDTLNAVVYRQIPFPSDSIQYKLGYPVQLSLTTDQSKLSDPYAL